MQRGEIYLASFPFGDTATVKLRLLSFSGVYGYTGETGKVMRTQAPPSGRLA